MCVCVLYFLPSRNVHTISQCYDIVHMRVNIIMNVVTDRDKIIVLKCSCKQMYRINVLCMPHINVCLSLHAGDLAGISLTSSTYTPGDYVLTITATDVEEQTTTEVLNITISGAYKYIY